MQFDVLRCSKSCYRRSGAVQGLVRSGDVPVTYYDSMVQLGYEIRLRVRISVGVSILGLKKVIEIEMGTG